MPIFRSLDEVRAFCKAARADFGFLMDSGDGLKYGTAMRVRVRTWTFHLSRGRK